MNPVLLCEVLPIDRSSFRTLTPDVRESDEVVNGSTSLHQSVTEVRMLVEYVRLSGEIEVVDVISWCEGGVGGWVKNGFENDLGRGSSEIHDGG